MSREIRLKIPSVQTIILIVLLIGAFTSIVWVSVATNLEMPQPPAVPQQSSSQTQEGPAAWLSAWSTFWGAMATAIGAIVTAAAVFIAALTYKHQVDEKNREAADRRQKAQDKRRAQARAVKLAVSPRAGWNEFDCDMRNFSDLPVSALNVVSVNAAGDETKRHIVGVLIPDKPIRVTVPAPAVPSTSYASFIDAEGLSWKLYFDDRLEEQVPAQATTP